MKAQIDTRFDQILSTDVLDYFPMRHGLGPSKMGLRKLPHQSDVNKEKIFQFDRHFNFYRDNKLETRAERLSKFYQSNTKVPDNEVIKMWVERLCMEYPEFFKMQQAGGGVELKCELTHETLKFSRDYSYQGSDSKVVPAYVDAWDALSCQVAEDMVLQTLGAEGDECSRIHLCAANGWSAEWALGKSFDQIHAEVPRINTIVPRSRAMMEAILKSPFPMERIGGVNLRTRPELNRHPDIPREVRHPHFNAAQDTRLYFRFERQTVVPFPELKSFLFTIRTYIVDLVHVLKSGGTDAQAVYEAFKNPHPESNAIRFVRENQKDVLSFCETLGYKA